jgi:hypothetical protein
MCEYKSVAFRSRQSPWPAISVTDAFELIDTQCSSLEIIQFNLSPTIVGHVLSESIIAAEPHPAFAASIKDGYAVIGMFFFCRLMIIVECLLQLTMVVVHERLLILVNIFGSLFRLPM